VYKFVLDTLEFALYNWRKLDTQDFALAFALAQRICKILHLLLHWRSALLGAIQDLVTIA
jgi:hypothetical protein